VAATADQLRSWAEVDALRDFMREALVELARTHPRLFQTVDSDTIDVSNDDLSGKQVLARFSGEAEGAEAREEKRLQHLLKARFAHFLLTSEGRDFLESVLRQQLEEAQLLDGAPPSVALS